MSRRTRFGLLVTGILVLLSIFYLSVGDSPAVVPSAQSQQGHSANSKSAAESSFFAETSVDEVSAFGVPMEILEGGAIAPKLENKTAKQELGRASWRLLHTMMARFPEKPTAEESLALKTYIQLFARLYPCGDCAAHFQTVLAKYPPQTSSRNAAAGWACFVHNEVNKRVHHDIFDCNKIGDFYDCGCAEDDKEKAKGGKSEATDAGLKKKTPKAATKEPQAGNTDDEIPRKEATNFGETEKEGLSRGG